MANVIFGWSTKKTTNGNFKYTVTITTPLNYINPTSGNYAATELIQEGFMPTRNRAKTKALQWRKQFIYKYNQARLND